MTDAETSRLHGNVALSPMGRVTAGSYGTWTVTYTAGALGVDENASVKLYWRFASDWGRPQFQKPSEPDYATVSTSAAARLEAAYEAKGHIRPWGRCVQVDVRDGSLAPGDTLTITLGDTPGGSPGSRAQTFRQQGFEFGFLVDAHGTWQSVQLPVEIRLDIVPGPAARLVVVAPSALVAGEPARVVVRAEDEWGNPATGFAGEVNLTAPASGAQVVVAEEGLAEFRVRLSNMGVTRLAASAEGLPPAESNPVCVTGEAPKLRRYWGDLHGQSAPTIGTGTIAEYFEFARGPGVLDFTSHQGNDFQITREQWEETKRRVGKATEDARFVALLGYEWSGNPGVGGDHNVLFLGEDEQIHRSSHMQVADTSDAHTDRSPIEDLLAELRGRDALTIAHVGGRPADLARFDDEVERLVEIHAAWGTFEWMLTDSLALGRKVGVVANSDDHSGRPGANRPGAGHFGTQGGLTCVLASELTREAVFGALRARRCYGTSGPRILVDATVAGSVIGAECSALASVPVAGSIQGTAPLERVDLFRGTEVIHTWRPEGSDEPTGRKLRVAWSGQRVRGRARQVHWDGGLTIRGNKIVSAEPYAFDSPAEGISGHSDSHVEWVSKTCGDADGVALELAEPYTGTLTFETGVTTFALPLTVLRDGPFVAEAGGLDQRVTVEAVREEPGPLDMELEYTDVPPAGEHAYWLRVVQEDGHRAWTSPAFVVVR